MSDSTGEPQSEAPKLKLPYEKGLHIPIEAIVESGESFIPILTTSIRYPDGQVRRVTFRLWAETGSDGTIAAQIINHPKGQVANLSLPKFLPKDPLNDA